MTLQLKCQLPTGKTTTTRFPLTLTIGEVKQQIIHDTQTGGPDHSLYLPPIPMVRNGLWLQDDRTITFYDLKTGDMVVLRKRTAPKKFLFEDQTQKVILIDESLPVKAIIDQVLGEHMSITNPEEFGMLIEGAGRDDWLDTKLTIAQQGVPDDAVLCIKKRYFFNDANIDTTDPMQLHLQWLQINTQVLEGQHPMTLEEGVQLAALQCQIQHGDYDPKQYPAGYLSDKLHKLMGQQHYNPKKDKSKTVKKLETEIFREWRKHIKLSAVNAKYRYSQIVRALPTWGIVYYLCQEPIPGDKKGKLRDVLVGINRDGAVFAEPKTFERLKTLPWTKIKRWSPSPTTITIDCGDYADDYFRAYTPHGEKIAQMMSGYIEIILTKRSQGPKPDAMSGGQVAQQVQIVPQHGIAVEASSLSRARGGAPMQNGASSEMGDGAYPYGYDSSRQGAASSSGDMAGAGGGAWDGGQFLITDFSSAIHGLELLSNGMGAPLPAAFDGMSAEDAMHTYSMAYAGVLKGVELFGDPASMSPDDMTSLGKYLHEHLGAMINAAKRAGSNGDVNVSLLNGAYALSQAVAKVLQCARDVNAGSPDPAGVSFALQQAMKLYSAAAYSINAMQAGLLADKPSEEWILGSAALVVEAMARFAADCESVGFTPQHTAQVRDTAALLQAAAASLARGMIDPTCQTAINELITALHGQAGQLVLLAQQHQLPESALLTISASANALTQALSLLKDVSAAPLSSDSELAFKLPSFLSRANDGLEALLGCTGAQATLLHANAVEVHCVDVSRATQSCARLLTPSNAHHDGLLGSAKLVTEASSTVRQFAEQGNQPHALQWAKHLGGQLGQLASVTDTLCAYGVLLEQTKLTAAALAGMAALSMSAAARCSDAQLGRELLDETAAASAALLSLVPYIQHFQADPGALPNQKALYAAARATTLPASKLVAVSMRAVPAVADQNVRGRLNDASKNTNAALQRLLAACDEVSARFGGKEFGESMQIVQQALAQLNSLIIQAQGGALERNVDADPVQCYDAVRDTLLGAAKGLKDVQLGVANDPDAIGVKAKAMAEHINRLAGDAKTLAQTYPDRVAQQTLLTGAKNVAQQSSDFLVSVRGLLTDPSPQLHQELEETTRAISQAISNLIAAARSAGTGSNEECAKAAEQISAAAAEQLQQAQQQVTPDIAAYIAAVKQTRLAVIGLDGAVQQVATLALVDPKGLALAAGSTGSAFLNFAAHARSAQCSARTPQCSAAIAQQVQHVAEHTVAGLGAARAAKVNTRAAAELHAAVGNAKKHLDLLLSELDEGLPGKPQIVQAITKIEDALAASRDDDGSSASVAEMCRAGKALGGAIGKVVAAVRSSPEAAAGHALQAAEQTRSIVLCAKQFQTYDGDVQTLVAAARELGNATGGDATALVAKSRQLLEVASPVFTALRRLSQQTDYVANVDALSEAVKLLVAKATQLAKTPDSGNNSALTLATLLKSLESRANSLSGKLASAQGLTAEHVELSSSGFATAHGTLGLLRVISQLCDDPGDQVAKAALINAQREAAGAIRQLTQLATALAPAQRECDAAILATNNMLEDLEAIDFEIMSGIAGERQPSRPGVEHDQFAQELVRTAHQLEAACRAAGNPGSANLGQLVAAIGALIPKFTADTKDTVFSSSGELQSDRLQLSKRVGEHVAAMLTSLKRAAVDNEDMEAAQRLGTELSNIGREIGTLSDKLQSTRLQLEECDRAIRAIAEAAGAGGALAAALPPLDALGYQRSVHELTEQCNAFKTALNSVAKSPASQLAECAAELAAQYCQHIVPAVRQCAGTISQAPLQRNVVAGAEHMARCAVAIVEACKLVAVDPADAVKQQTLATRVRDGRASIIDVVNAAKAGATGAKACEQAASDIGDVVQKVDADYLYAAAGQMDVSDVDASVSLADCHSDTLASVQQVQALVRSLSAAHIGQLSQDQLGTTATQLAALVKRVATATKTMAAILSDIATQQHILQAAKSLALSVQNVVVAAKKLHDDPSNAAAAELSALSARKFDEDAESLVAVANSSSAEIIQSQRELDAAKARVTAALAVLSSSAAVPPGDYHPERIVVSLRQIAKNTADIVSASSSSVDGLINVARAMAGSAESLTHEVRGSFKLTSDAAVQQALRTATSGNIDRVLALLDAIRQQRADDPRSFLRVSEASTALADSLHETVVAARRLPGGENLELEENDLGAMAEKELLAAADAIDKAAARLLRLPKRQERAATDFLDNHDIAEAIIGAARAITDATRTLVHSATSVQRELAAAGKVNPHLNVYKKDPAWAMGLISAAQAVSGSVEDLVESANQCAKDDANEESEARLIAAVMMVGGATARLVAASRVKADPNSPSQARLENAAKAVAAATKRLSEAARSRDSASSAAAQASAAAASEASLTAVQRRRLEFEKQVEIEKLRKQLEVAQQGVFSMRKDDYSGAASSSRPASSVPAPPPRRQ